MVNITHKSNSLRKAIASAVVLVSSEETIRAVKEKKVPKGDVFEFAKVAALFAVKKTSDTIPDCHPLSVEYTQVNYQINQLSIEITVEVHTVYKTGVEVEAMYGASVAALTVYDMLKPIDKHIEIQHIRLLHKEGGKSQYTIKQDQIVNAAVIVCSDSIYQGKAEDHAGLQVIERLKSMKVNINQYEVIPDESDSIKVKVKTHTENQLQLLIFVGGTGASKRDITPDVIKPLLDKELPGVMEHARNYGQDRMPYAMLSRSIAGFIGDTLVLTLPGSLKGSTEYMDSLFPHILHALEIFEGAKH
jgi:molybdenum cofactor biosynthesis protein MoaC